MSETEWEVGEFFGVTDEEELFEVRYLFSQYTVEDYGYEIIEDVITSTDDNWQERTVYFMKADGSDPRHFAVDYDHDTSGVHHGDEVSPVYLVEPYEKTIIAFRPVK